MTDRCETCRFWLNWKCRRYPPERVDGEGTSVYPMTAATDWCGEFDAASAKDTSAKVVSLLKVGDLARSTGLDDGLYEVMAIKRNVLDGADMSRYTLRHIQTGDVFENMPGHLMSAESRP